MFKSKNNMCFYGRRDLLKRKSIEFFLATLFYLLAIVEKLLNLGIFSWLYSTINQTTVFYLLLIVGTAFIITYLIELKRKPTIQVFTARHRPSTIDVQRPYFGNDYGVKWRLYEPDLLDRRPWADGPFCPKCDRELEEETRGRIFKQEVWKCPICEKEYIKPKGDVKDMVEKNFAAYLRKKGKL